MNATAHILVHLIVFQMVERDPSSAISIDHAAQTLLEFYSSYFLCRPVPVLYGYSQLLNKYNVLTVEGNIGTY